ncbi:hypothetical protein [Streptomyces sp. NBC_00328]|uniref:hypothetical protein n=1 Tax=Streptomyces sp. NBC_00328 TaxID=2903646 RepID=UPI002E2E08CF|nr:hypothetical protein [Streptomyces sp. NBC_00328]
MTEDEPKPWVGDQVWDEDAEKEGVVTDVKAGTYIIREVYAWARTWTAPGPEHLKIMVTREERLRQRQELGW